MLNLRRELRDGHDDEVVHKVVDGANELSDGPRLEGRVDELDVVQLALLDKAELIFVDLVLGSVVDVVQAAKDEEHLLPYAGAALHGAANVVHEHRPELAQRHLPHINDERGHRGRHAHGHVVHEEAVREVRLVALTVDADCQIEP